MDDRRAPARRARSASDRRDAAITPRDRELLAFAAEHRFVLRDHVMALLDVSANAASARLRSLTALGALSLEPPSSYRITGKGLGLIGSELPPPRVDWRSYRHDIGVAWLWLAAREGIWGQIDELVSERRMRSWDEARVDGEAPVSVRLGGIGPGGKERLHYPDLVLITSSGHRIALELELSSKGRARRERILAGYGADARIDVVLYLVEDPSTARALRTSARRLALSDRVRVQPVRWGSAERHADAQAAAIKRSPQPDRPSHRAPALSS